MAQNLMEYLRTHRPRGFNSVPYYSAHGDFVTYFFRNDRCYAQRVDDLLTVFLPFDTDELVGCKIKGVRQILQTAGDFGLLVDDGDVRLGMFFLVGALSAKDPDQRDRYDQIGRKAKDVSIDRNALRIAC